MPAKPAEPHHAHRVQELLHHHGAAHLRARTYGSAVLVESGPTDDRVKHVRLRRDSVHLWCLDIANHRGQWERTPLRANLDDLVQLVLDDFPWTLTPTAD
ncbi:MAG TPA: hypothetical protein VKP65_10180 [Rhodothermales bacterium]|nr:hypothetical protein [Rhodothermales bacterium]